jgi:hypothetical protein
MPYLLELQWDFGNVAPNINLSEQCHLHQIIHLEAQQRCYRLQNLLVLICQFALLTIYVLRQWTQESNETSASENGAIKTMLQKLVPQNPVLQKLVLQKLMLQKLLLQKLVLQTAARKIGA